MENLEQGLLLMVVGLLTVFFILLIVIGAGKMLIKAVNRFALEEEIPKKEKIPDSLYSEDTAILAAVVNIVTAGRGKVAKIEKL